MAETFFFFLFDTTIFVLSLQYQPFQNYISSVLSLGQFSSHYRIISPLKLKLIFKHMPDRRKARTKVYYCLLQWSISLYLKQNEIPSLITALKSFELRFGLPLNQLQTMAREPGQPFDLTHSWGRGLVEKDSYFSTKGTCMKVNATNLAEI